MNLPTGCALHTAALLRLERADGITNSSAATVQELERLEELVEDHARAPCQPHTAFVQMMSAVVATDMADFVPMTDAAALGIEYWAFEAEGPD